MNLEHTQGKIIFKPNAKVEIERIAKAVVNAGFSLRYLSVIYSFTNVSVKDNFCFSFEGNQYQFLKTGAKTLNGEMTLKFIGKEFLSRKEYKQWEPDLKPVCDKSTGVVYFVTL